MNRRTLLVAACTFASACGDSGSTTPAPDDLSVLDFRTPADLAMPDLAKPDLAMPDLLMPDLAKMPTALVVFGDDYAAGVAFAPFGGSTNDLAIDKAEHHTGTASLRINIPNAGYTGGAMVGAPADLSPYTAVTFWAKASKATTFDTFGLGNNSMGGVQYQAETHAVMITANWTKFTIPLPNPAKLKSIDGLFHFATGGNGPYSVWLDDIQYENVAVGAASAAIATETVTKNLGEAYDVMGAAATWMVGGAPVTVIPSRDYLDYTSSNVAVATVDVHGHITTVAAGMTIITAKLAGVAANGMLTLTVNAGAQCMAGQIFTDDYCAGIAFGPFGGSTNDVKVDMAEHHSGTASLKINIPNAGYTGGAMVGMPKDLSSYTAVTFWAKASKATTFDTIGMGNNAMGGVQYQAETHAVMITANWTKYTLPLPAAAPLKAIDGLFHFATGGNGPYSVWLDDIQYENVAVGAAAPTIATETVNKQVGDGYDVMGVVATWMINGQPVTVIPTRDYFTYASSANAVATVDAHGHVTAVAVGSADITAKLGGVDALGKLTVKVTQAQAPNAAPPRPVVAAASVISLLSNAYVNVPVDTWRTPWSNATEARVKVGADDVEKYTSLVFVGVETVVKTIDATAMTAFHMDVWTPDSTSFKIKLVDFGADGKFGGGDDSECELAYDKNSNPPLVLASWVSFEIPLANFKGANCTEGAMNNLKAQAHMAQYIFSGSNSTAYVDNVYFHK